MILISHSGGDDAATNVFTNDTDGLEYLIIKEIEAVGGTAVTGTSGANWVVGADSFKLHLTGYSKILVSNDTNPLGYTKHKIFASAPAANKKMVFAQPTMNGYSQYSVNRINAQDPAGMGWEGPELDATGKQIGPGKPGIMAVGYNLDFIE